MSRKISCLDFIKNHYILLIIAIQPVLDIIAYWTKNPDGTIAGTIRLAIMLLLPLYLLFSLKDKRDILRFLISMFIIGVFCIFHIANSMRVGYINMVFDVSYIAKTAQMPILAVCFTFLIKDEQTKKQAMSGLVAAALLYFSGIILAVVSGTAVDTYGKGLGVSGWVIGDNRCANSVIYVTLAVVMLYFAVKSDNKYINIILPPLLAFALISNGTKACYYSLFAACVGFACFLVLDKIIHGGKLKTRVIAILMLTAIVSAAVYPITPRYKIELTQQASSTRQQGELERIMQEMGYDLKSMTLEEKLSNPDIVQVFGDYYWDLIWAIIPDMFDRFTYEEICEEYEFCTDAGKLIDVRRMKTAYASMMWNHCDSLTRLAGFEVSDIWFNGGTDLENDWPAIYYYYGYVGFGLYLIFMLWFVVLIVKRVLLDFKGTVTLENFFLLLCLGLHVGLAQFSGSVLRRPNVSIYMALILGLIYYKTVYFPVSNSKEEKAV